MGIYIYTSVAPHIKYAGPMGPGPHGPIRVPKGPWVPKGQWVPKGPPWDPIWVPPMGSQGFSPMGSHGSPPWDPMGPHPGAPGLHLASFYMNIIEFCIQIYNLLSFLLILHHL